jgi:copper transport protein
LLFQRGSLLLRSAMALVAFLFLVCIVGVPQQAFAMALHAQYDHSNPASNARQPSGEPPKQVQVWFTETVDPHFSDLKVYNQARQRVDLNDSHAADPYSLLVSVRPNLPDAAYTVVFSNISSEDGHHVVGAFSFVVGAGALPTNTDALVAQMQSGQNNFNVWSVGLRWLNYLGMALLLGAVAFILFVWRPTFVSLREQIGAAISKADVGVERGALRIMGGSMLLLFAATLGFLIYQAAFASASAPWEIVSNGALNNLLFQSRFGVVWWIRVALLALAGGVALLSWRRLFRRAKRPHALYNLLIFLSIAIMTTTSLDAHAAAKAEAWLLLPFDLIHLVSTGFWIGGVFCLAILLPISVRKLASGSGESTQLLAALLPRFSVVAICCVVLLVVTGTIQAVFDVGSWEALWGSSYGQTLLIKIGLFVLLLALGAFHLLRISPQLRAFAAPAEGEVDVAEAGKVRTTFGKSIRLEAALAVVLLVIVGALTSLSPPPPGASVKSANQSGSAPLTYQGKMDDLVYRLIVNPGRVGMNTFEVSLKERNGQPLTKADGVRLRFTMLDMDMGTQELDLMPVPDRPGHYTVNSIALGMSGHWKMTLLVYRTGFDDAQVAIDLSVPEN